ncbi:hypothetical protein ACS5PN_30885 [Roseateles sp. NT4]|uniref:hypothetical protein n=1 Tax=Roseateles sp. NT4 TaxID=3453715 RepID=UPI003EECBD69
MQIATAAARNTFQLPGLFASSAEVIRPTQCNFQRPYGNEVRDSFIRRTSQMSDNQSHNRRVQFLAGVDVREISMDKWTKANAAFKPV